MKKLLLAFLVLVMLAMPVSAMDYDAPPVPAAGSDYMPRETESFGADLLYIIKQALFKIKPEIASASALCLSIAGVIFLTSLLVGISKRTQQICEFVYLRCFSIQPIH